MKKNEKKPMSKKVKLIIIIIVAVLFIGAGITTFILLRKNCKNKAVVGTWDFYVQGNYGEVSFEFNKDNTFKFKSTGSQDQEGTYEKYDEYVILKFKDTTNNSEEVYAIPYVLYLKDDKMCVSSTKCDGQTDGYLTKREGEGTPTTTTTVSTTTKAQTLDSSEVTMYIFFGDGCPHCAELNEYINSDSFFKDVKIVKYETWYDANNQELVKKVGKKLGVEVNGVPFIVIGNKYFEGYSSSMNDEIKNTITSYKNKKSKYTDIVYKLVK